MNDAIFVLISAFIGLVLLNSAVFICARGKNIKFLGALSLEVRYIAWLSFIFLIALNANQWMAGNFLFPLLACIAAVLVFKSIEFLTISDYIKALGGGLSLFALQLLSLLIIFFAFQMQNYWILEGANHDSVIYYQGLHWATDSRMFVEKESVRALWGLGVCGEGGPWIGTDCPLYRGGTYTLAAWIQYFAPVKNGNGLYLVALYATTIVWFSIRLLPVSIIDSRRSVIFGGLSLVAAFSTGLIGALTNSNLATVLGAASLVPIVCLALRPDILPWVRFGLMSAWCAVAAHVYAESVFYAGLFISLVFLWELPNHLRSLRLGGVIALGVFIILIVFGAGNIAIYQAFSSILLFNELPKGNAWFSWYLHQSNFLWIGSFVAGLLMGANMPSSSIVIFASLITTLAVIVLIYSSDTRGGIFALVGTSLLAVLYIELTNYQYGEHKIVHLLGPAWTLILVAASSSLLGWGRAPEGGVTMPSLTKTVGGFILLGLVFIVTAFSFNAFLLLKNLRGSHGIDFGLPTVASYIRPGEKVLVDETAWAGVEKFQKTHYLTFQIHNRGAEVLLPQLGNDPLRGGYVRGNRNDTFGRAGAVDWLIKSRGNDLSSSKLFSPTGGLVWENSDVRLYRVEKKPVIAAGSGWYDCEFSFCWTNSPFDIEVFVPQEGDYQVKLDFGLYHPPTSGLIKVKNGAGMQMAEFKLPIEQLHIALPQGWSKLVFESDWKVTSPLQAGESADSRLLFAAIKRIEVISTRKQADK